MNKATTNHPCPAPLPAAAPAKILTDVLLAPLLVTLLLAVRCAELLTEQPAWSCAVTVIHSYWSPKRMRHLVLGWICSGQVRIRSAPLRASQGMPPGGEAWAAAIASAGAG